VFSNSGLSSPASMGRPARPPARRRPTRAPPPPPREPACPAPPPWCVPSHVHQASPLPQFSTAVLRFCGLCWCGVLLPQDQRLSHEATAAKPTTWPLPVRPSPYRPVDLVRTAASAASHSALVPLLDSWGGDALHARWYSLGESMAAGAAGRDPLELVLAHGGGPPGAHAGDPIRIRTRCTLEPLVALRRESELRLRRERSGAGHELRRSRRQGAHVEHLGRWRRLQGGSLPLRVSC
jgi:hypothetical protein